MREVGYETRFLMDLSNLLVFKNGDSKILLKSLRMNLLVSASMLYEYRRSIHINEFMSFD